VAGLLLAVPGLLLAEETPDDIDGSDAEVLVVHGSHVVASGYEARGSSVQRLDLDRLTSTPGTLAEALSRLPGVAENGQGGWVQMVSLRGVSRQRVLTLLAGMPILTDRRAGTAAHFVDPALLGEVSVMAGPASAIYGAGALGGIVQLFPRQVEGAMAGVQLDNNGEGRGGYVGWGDDTSTAMLAGLIRDDSEAGDGRVINDHGERWSALLRQRWALTGGELELIALPAVLKDVGRANANFYGANLPERRITETPEENHVPVRLSYRANSGWEAAAFVHDSFVSNVTDRVGVSVTTVDNEATDTGINFQLPWQTESWRGRVGTDMLARMNVNADESLYTRATDNLLVRDALNSAREQQFSVFGEAETALAGGELQWGLRVTAQQQSATGEQDVNDDAMASHLGWERLFDDRWFVFGSIGSAVRFPALTERFYHGATARGTLIGNAELAPETALSFDLGVRSRWAGAVVTAQIYQQLVIQNSPQINSYVNLTSGRIDGLELDARWSLSDTLTLDLTAHRIRGKADDGSDLADIPADRWQLGLSQQFNLSQQMQECALALSWTWRQRKSDVGADEIELDRAEYGEASVKCAVGQHWHIATVVSNASDEVYLTNADSQAALAPGRRISVRLAWQ